MRLLLLLSVSALAASQSLGAVVWNESIQGDLSDNNLSPTPLVFSIGVNNVKGTMGKDLPQDPVDRDMFTFTLPLGQALTSINVQVFTPTNQSFYAIAPGTTINDADPATHLANQLVKGTGEFLPTLAGGSYGGGTGLTNPVPAGTYTIWFQELSSVVTYDIAYTVTAVPEPATGSILAAGLLAVVGRRRRA